MDLKNVKHYWESIRDIMFHYEETSYNLNDIAYTSNRAKRAQSVDDTEFDDLIVDHNNAPDIYCTIHLDNGPAVLWLRKPDDIEDSTNDFTLNFPLAKHSKLQKCLVSNPICGYCADGYFAVRKESIYHQPIDGYVPINVANNKQYIYLQLCKILCGNKKLGHVMMLLLGMIDDCNYNWIDQNIRDYMITQLVNNVVTTETFTEEGKKTNLLQALSLINSQTVVSQPFYALYRLLILAKIHTKTDNNLLVSHARESVRYSIVTSITDYLLKHGYQSLVSYCDQHIYQTLCGIPTVEDINSVKLPQLTELKDLMFQLNDMLEVIDRFSKVVNEVDLIPEPMVGQILCACKQITTHERPLTVYNKLIATHRYFGQTTQYDKNTTLVQLRDELIGKYHKIQDYNTPPFAFYNGCESCPSKLFFFDQCLIGKYLGQIVDLDLLSDDIREMMTHKLCDNFGSVYPNNTSGHINLHKIVARTCHDYPKDIPDLDILSKCVKQIKDTGGKKGNIYQPNTIINLIYCVYNFLDMRRTSKHYQPDLTFTYKVKCELLEQGGYLMNGNYIKIPAQLTPPINLYDKYKHLPVQEIIQQLDQYIKDQNQTNPEQPCLEYIMQTPLKIEVPLKQQNTTAWENEQNQIVKNTSLVDTIPF